MILKKKKNILTLVFFSTVFFQENTNYNANIYYNDITINIITSNLKMKCNNYESLIIILIQAKQEHIFRIISTFI